MWSDVQPQPNFDYVKKRIAKAINVKASDFRFEKAGDTKLDYKTVIMDKYNLLCTSSNRSGIM